MLLAGRCQAGGESQEPYSVHFSVMDGHGNAVSFTYTLNGDFGAYLVPAGSGVVLNNSLSDFNNKVKPGLNSRKLYEAMGHKIVEFKGLFGPAMCSCFF